MLKGGLTHKPRFAKTIRYAGLVIPLILIIYGYFIQAGIIDSLRVVDSVGVAILSFWWILISILQFIRPSKTKIESALKLLAYHLLAGSYLVFVLGASSPFVICWIILIVSAYAYFGVKGYLANFFVLACFIACDIFLNYHYDNGIFARDVTTFIALAIAGLIVIKIASLQDISEKELEYAKTQVALQRDRALTIINNLADAVLSTDMHGIIRIYNASSMNLLDTNVDLNGHFIDEVIPLHNKDDNKVSLFKLLQETKVVTKRDDLIFKIGSDDNMILEAIYSPIHSTYVGQRKSGVHEGYVIILRDVTKAKSLEEERDEFVSVISHELRTPLTIAEGTISNTQLMIQHGDVTKQMLSDAINTAHDQILFLSGMVNDLGTLSRAERGVADNAEDIDVLELAYKLHDKYVSDAKSKKLHFDLDIPSKLGYVHVSRLYLEEILQNLITNALKYTKKGGAKLIIGQKNDLITFSIKDSGIGISKTDQAKIFTKFYRSEDYRTRETGGTGLGLYIVDKLSRKIGTKITLSSRLNFGSTFSFTLPAAKPPLDLTNDK